MRRHLTEFSKSPLGACVPAATRLASRGPAARVRGGAPRLRAPAPQRLALARGGAPAFALPFPSVLPSPAFALGTPAPRSLHHCNS